MTQSSPSADPLDGFRGRDDGNYEQMEEELLSFRALSQDDADFELLRNIIKHDAIMEALQQEGSAFQRLATHAVRCLDVARKDYEAAGNPHSDEAIDAHLRARAARLVVDWIETELEAGRQATQQVEANE